MERRTFLGVIAGGLLAAPLAAEAQPAGKVYRIGWLTPAVMEAPSRSQREALRALGYVEGQAVAFESRSAEDHLERLPRLAADLVDSKVDVIVAVCPPAILAARQATDTIPIVMAYWGAGGLIESGIVANFARLGGNVTGVYMLAAELEVKRLELLLQAVPKARNVAVLDLQAVGFTLTEVQKVAEARGVQLHVTAVGSGREGYQRAFDGMAKARVEALLVPSLPRYFRDARQIIVLAAKRRIPAVYEWPSMAEAGGLMAYGPTFAELDGRVAAFIDRILKGAKPAEIPVIQPTKFELVINLKTAKALGLTIPPSLLQRADQVIE
ncbi:MAG TPA: ABC transporter substrate-binding protein [Candidatus Polarisedimenticolia bacterium]|nr:ABC transporter substrate-binding protein [Candidatus Polarisedimenticolia bacterium]